MDLAKKNISCDRCNGFGIIEKYKNIESGICFKCEGRGWGQKEDTATEACIQQYKERKIANQHYEILVQGIEVAECWKDGLWHIEGIDRNNKSYNTSIHPQQTKKEIVKMFMKKYY
jgi:hypothetical protein